MATSGYLLPYPIRVDGKGKVSNRPGFTKFPDTNGDVLGTKSNLFPDLLTT